MSSFNQRLVFAAALLLVVSLSTKKSDGEMEQWCIADEQTPDNELLSAITWACEKGRADCSKVQVNQPCFWPNTTIDHASYVFNNYFQQFKHTGGSCYFNGAGIVTDLDPSHGSCQYEFIA
ncbi:Glucan endo-1,3-beta-glucosidase 12 [Linum grandiflorum]